MNDICSAHVCDFKIEKYQELYDKNYKIEQLSAGIMLIIDHFPLILGPHTSANIGVLSSCLDLRTVIPEPSVSSTIPSAQTMVTQQTIKTESSSTNGAVVKDETSLTTFSTKSEGLKCVSHTVF